MVPESVVASPTTDSKSTLSNENIVCPHGLLNPTKAEQMKRIGFVSLSIRLVDCLLTTLIRSSESLLCKNSASRSSLLSLLLTISVGRVSGEW